MHKTVHVALALAALALGIWAYYALPGWVGLLVFGVLLLCAVVATVIAALGARGTATGRAALEGIL